MVCLGNICRSPLAEGILQSKADAANLGWTVHSAGTAGYHTGEPPHHLSQKVAKLNGINISSHEGRRFTAADMDTYDLIYVMDAQNYQDVKKIARDKWAEHKTNLILNELHPGENRGVPDPWYGTEEGYHQVYDMLSKASDLIIEKYGRR
ncbi:low molecular weight phosphotyrosine protein phosphatase [Deminuibacter soli]|uniref:protein-tyrosine-phosphatase n=2 Tax=Deminuibacter soli TaxID=2291815 RepID=A0A3E1NP74_9BACT|nr:low molecular weight phosphotyrosine protein phosphatase [Deminuibacter soli]